MLLQDTVRRSAECRPGATAIRSNDRRVTYSELDELSDRIASLLRATGCEEGDRVGLLLPKSVAAIAAMLGTLKARAIYVPMDTASPAARLAKIVQACEPRVMLGAGGTAADLLDQLREEAPAVNDTRVGWLDASSPAARRFEIAFAWTDVLAAPVCAPDSAGRPEDPAHILFTSGSTGIPKGVVITHENVMHFLTWAARYFGTAPSDRISCHPPLHFDLSTFDIYGTFLAGAELHLVPPETSMLPHKIAEFIRRNALTQWFSVPSVMKYMAQFDVVRDRDFPALQRVLWCGEALPAPTLIYWMRRLPGVSFTNLYGPTETTIASSFYTVPSCPTSERAEIPIGRACDGEELLVLDGSLQPAALGQTGDLYIRGVGLSPGYWHDPQKTHDAFIEHGEGGRMYRTGDLARIGEDGLVYLLGRADSQIKSRGYRIELGEIETALHALGLLRECAVVGVRSDGFEGTAICCAYVRRPDRDVSPDELRQRLSAAVPSYMLPTRWLDLDQLPLNANGKIDRPRLREHFQAAWPRRAMEAFSA